MIRYNYNNVYEENKMENYVSPMLEIYNFENCDIVTASDSNDNNFGDIDWD